MTQLKIEIVYALPIKITELVYEFEGTKTIEEVLNETGFLTQNSIDLENHTIGIYGKLMPLDYILKNGDRIEIYRPLINDPKTIRRKRAQKA